MSKIDEKRLREIADEHDRQGWIGFDGRHSGECTDCSLTVAALRKAAEYGYRLGWEARNGTAAEQEWELRRLKLLLDEVRDLVNGKIRPRESHGD